MTILTAAEAKAKTRTEDQMFEDQVLILVDEIVKTIEYQTKSGRTDTWVLYGQDYLPENLKNATLDVFREAGYEIIKEKPEGFDKYILKISWA